MAKSMNWRLAKSLEKLREQINAAHPSRSKESDGSIGDTAHQQRNSEHNPDANGVVRTIDITHDPEHGVDGHILSRQLVTDSRMYYVIFAGEIYKSRTGQWEAYHGLNAHQHHVHISVIADAHEYDDTAPWTLSDVPVKVITRSTLKFGDTGSAVAELQKALGIRADASFGADTLKSVKEFQRDSGLIPDGVCGLNTWNKLREVGRIV